MIFTCIERGCITMKVTTQSKLEANPTRTWCNILCKRNQKHTHKGGFYYP